MRRAHRVVAVAALAALSGCTAVGTVDITPNQVNVDVTVTEPIDSHGIRYCRDTGMLPATLKRAMLPSPSGTITCRIHGSFDPRNQDADITYLSGLQFGNELVFLRTPGTGEGVPGAEGMAVPVERVDLRITFPGEVIGSTIPGATRGNALTLTRPEQLAGLSSLTVARSSGFDPTWWWFIAGLPAATVVGAAATRQVLRRRPWAAAIPDADAPADDPAAPPAPAGPRRGSDAPAALPPEDPNVWSPS